MIRVVGKSSRRAIPSYRAASQRPGGRAGRSRLRRPRGRARRSRHRCRQTRGVLHRVTFQGFRRASVSHNVGRIVRCPPFDRSAPLRRLTVVSATAATAALLLTGMTAPAVAADGGVVINEFSVNTDNTMDDFEYLELLAAPGTDLSSYRVLEIEGRRRGVRPHRRGRCVSRPGCFGPIARQSGAERIGERLGESPPRHRDDPRARHGPRH